VAERANRSVPQGSKRRAKIGAKKAKKLTLDGPSFGD
jgi:hypothetical protein